MKFIVRNLGAILAAGLLAAPLAAKTEMTALRVLVQNEAGKPVPQASVIVRRLKGKKNNKVAETFQLRTSQQGVAPLPPLPRGFVLIQVIAEEHQTFGDRFELTEPEQSISITLKPPQKQHSVHEK
jgi:hypothetical protein